MLILTAFASKLVGAGLPAYFLGLSARGSLAVGIGMSARGAVELIVADIALRAGLFEHPDPPPPVVAQMFSAVVIVAVVTTVAIPIAMRQIFTSESEPSSDAEEPAESSEPSESSLVKTNDRTNDPGT